MERHSVGSISALQDKVIHENGFFDKLLQCFSVTVTEMFRDPSFYKEFREKVIPLLKTYPYFKIWHAGCSTGQEVYSLAILLEEFGILDRSTIYATDINPLALKVAKKGIYKSENIALYKANYAASGGEGNLTNYYSEKYDSVLFSERLRSKITFATHNLATDGVFGEMNVVLCRNVMIYFDQTLQNRALELFSNSLCRHGVLCIGSRESLDYSSVVNKFDKISGKEKIYKKNELK